MKKVIIIILISIFVFSCSWFLNIDEQFRDIKVNDSGKREGESITFSSENPDVGEIVTITARLGAERKVKLSAPGVDISPETIVTNGGTAAFVMPKEVVTIKAVFSNLEAGDAVEHTAGSETFTMVYANDSTSIKFPTGENDGGSETLTTRFWIAETETTNAVVEAVLQWAYDNGKFDTANSGAHNYLSDAAVKYGGQELVELDASYCRINYGETTSQFTVDAGYADYPVVVISWYGAVMICNWLTEMRDGNIANVVYTGMSTDYAGSDDAWNHTETLEDRTKNGFRLPGEWEWEYAGRYRGEDDTNMVSGYTDPHFTKGNSASGATADYNSADACKAMAWYSANAAVIHPVGGKPANTLGLHDMSGNVWEWCFDDYDGSETIRVIRGGSWYNDASNLQLGHRGYATPSNVYGYIGFRLCRTAD